MRVVWFTNDDVVARAPDAGELLSRVDALGGARLSSANVDRWANDAEDLLLTLEQVTLDNPAMTRPLYQRLLRRLARNRAEFDSQEDRQVLLDVAERTTAGLVQACVGEPPRVSTGVASERQDP